MAELKKQGMVLPPTNPWGCRISSSLLTTDHLIEVQGTQTSGEVEVLAFVEDSGPRWISVGSDHCDRSAESFSHNMPKQLCPKPCCHTVWPFDEVKDHWDQLVLQCRVKAQLEWQTCQHGNVSSQLALPDLLELIACHGPGLVLFCGTIPFALDEEIYPESYELMLQDPILKRQLTHQYDVVVVDERTDALPAGA